MLAADSSKTPWLPIALCALLFVGLRLAVVVALGDVFFYGEELEKAAAGKLILEGLDVPRHSLAYHAYEGGGFVTSHIDALGFALLGPSVLTLKLLAVLWSLATLIAGAIFVARYFGQTASVVFALLFSLAPPSLVLASLLNLGIHFQALLFVPLILGPALHLGTADPASKRAWFCLGLASGFGIYYSYQNVVVTAFALLAVLLLNPRSLLCRAVHFGWIGGLLGSLPLLWMASHAGSAIFDIHGTQLAGAGSSSGRFETLRAFFGSLYAQASPAAWIVPCVVLGAGLIGTWFNPWRGSDSASLARKAWFCCVLFLVFELLAYSLSGFAVGAFEHPFALNRLSFVALAGLFVVAPVLGASLRRPGGLRVSAVVLLGAWVLASLWGLLGLIREGRPGPWRENLEILSTRRGYDYPQYFAKIAPDLAGNAAEKLQLLMQIDEPDQAYLQRSAALALTDAWVSEEYDFDELCAVFAAQQVRDWHEFLPGLAGWLRYTTRAADPLERLQALEAYPAETRAYLAQAVSRWGLGLHVFEERLRSEAAIVPPLAYAERWYRGLGTRLLEAARLNPDVAERFLESLPSGVASSLRSGYQAALGAVSLR